ncbi:MAG: hypothetical protein QW318_07520 [Candidatus Caldarchaeum sp.]
MDAKETAPQDTADEIRELMEQIDDIVAKKFQAKSESCSDNEDYTKFVQETLFSLVQFSASHVAHFSFYRGESAETQGNILEAIVGVFAGVSLSTLRDLQESRKDVVIN